MIEAKTEQIVTVNQLQVALEEKQGQLSLLESREEALNADKDAMQTKMDTLVTRLKEARDANTHQEESYNADQSIIVIDHIPQLLFKFI